MQYSTTSIELILNLADNVGLYRLKWKYNVFEGLKWKLYLQYETMYSMDRSGNNVFNGSKWKLYLQ